MPTLHDTELHMHKDACVLTKKEQKLRLLKFDIHEKKADWLAVPLDGTPRWLYLQQCVTRDLAETETM